MCVEHSAEIYSTEPGAIWTIIQKVYINPLGLHMSWLGWTDKRSCTATFLPLSNKVLAVPQRPPNNSKNMIGRVRGPMRFFAAQLATFGMSARQACPEDTNLSLTESIIHCGTGCHKSAAMPLEGPTFCKTCDARLIFGPTAGHTTDV